MINHEKVELFFSVCATLRSGFGCEMQEAPSGAERQLQFQYAQAIEDLIKACSYDPTQKEAAA